MGHSHSRYHVAVRRLLATATLLATAGFFPAARAEGRIFVTNYRGDTVTVFPRNATGDLAPSATILGLPGDGPHQIAIHHRAGELIVANNLAYSVAVYDLASGVLKRRLSGPSTGIMRPTGVAVDPVNGEMYIANFWGNTITVYDVLAQGDTPPKRTILSSSLSEPVGLAIDLMHDELVVGNSGGSITIFERLSAGPSSPKRVIQGVNTTLHQPQGVALDLIHDEIIVANSSFSVPDRGSILAFRRTAAGDVAPIRTLEGNATRLCNPIAVALDLATAELVVANSNFGGGSCGESVTTYSLTASGDTAPNRTLAGALTAMYHPTSVAITSASSVTVKSRAMIHSVGAGAEVGYAIGATARGGDVFRVVLTDQLPGGLEWSLHGADAGSCTLSAAPESNLTCFFGDLARGESREIQVSAVSTDDTCPRITNQATVSFHDGTTDLTRLSSPAKITIRCRESVPRETGGVRVRR